jgi:hypothetical protein
MTPPTLLEPADNPYRSTVTWSEPGSRSYSGDELIELQAFVGPKAQHFLRKWLPRLEDPERGDVGISWICLFFPVLWFGFRKMYKPAVLILAATVVLTVMQQVLFVNLLKLVSVPAGSNIIVGLMINLVCALYGNAWYLNHAEASIARARREGIAGEQLLLTLARRGGTSILGLIGMWVLSFIGGAIGAIAMIILQIQG